MVRAYVYDRNSNERFIMEWEGRFQNYMKKILVYSMRNEMEIFHLNGLYAVIEGGGKQNFAIVLQNSRAEVSYNR